MCTWGEGVRGEGQEKRKGECGGMRQGKGDEEILVMQDVVYYLSRRCAPGGEIERGEEVKGEGEKGEEGEKGREEGNRWRWRKEIINL